MQQMYINQKENQMHCNNIIDRDKEKNIILCFIWIQCTKIRSDDDAVV